MTTAPSDEPLSHSEQSLLSSLRRRLRPPRLLSMTRAGKFFVLMTLGVGFGAINTGNNLLFLLFGMLLALIIASGILSEAVIRHTRIRRRLPRRIVAHHPAPGHFRLLNPGWWPALSIEASEQNPSGLRGPRAGQYIGPQRVPWWKFWRRQTGDAQRPLAAAYTLRVDADSELDLSTHYEFPARGEFKLPGVQLRTRFPFGLFEKTRRFPAPAKVVVYPDAHPTDEWLGRLDARRGDTARNRRGRGEDFYGLRDYRPGEDHRSIHWKSTARRGEPVVRENEARRRRAVLIVLDNRAPNTEPSAEDRERFEEGIRRVAGFIEALRRRGYRLQLATLEGMVRPGADGGTDALLRHLAVVELHSCSETAPVVDDDDVVDRRVIVGFRQLLSEVGSDDITLAIDELGADDEEEQ